MIKLQMNDKDGNIIQDDELVLEDGDILLCKINTKITQEMYINLSEQLRQTFKLAIKRSNNGEIAPILYDHNIDFKVLKIRSDKE